MLALTARRPQRTLSRLGAGCTGDVTRPGHGGRVTASASDGGTAPTPALRRSREGDRGAYCASCPCPYQPGAKVAGARTPVLCVLWVLWGGGASFDTDEDARATSCAGAMPAHRPQKVSRPRCRRNSRAAAMRLTEPLRPMRPGVWDYNSTNSIGGAGTSSRGICTDSNGAPISRRTAAALYRPDRPSSERYTSPSRRAPCGGATAAANA
jgi:hypothetical protein